MQIIEQFITGKKESQSLCEDELFISEDFIAVIDGVTAKDGACFDGKTGGKAAAEAVKAAIGELQRDCTAEAAFYTLNNAVADIRRKKDGYAAACAVIYSDFRHEVWSVGDCQCIVNGRVFTHEKEVDRILSEVRALCLELKRLEGEDDSAFLKDDPGREFIMPLLKKEKLLGNSKSRFGFSVLDGSALVENAVTVHTVNADSEIVLASDGYPMLCATLLESENELKRVLKDNPLCDGEYCSTKGVQPNAKSFDDRTYIRIKV